MYGCVSVNVCEQELRAVEPYPGTDVMFLKIFSPKIFEKILAFFPQQQ
jgi:hypothetical protein